MYRCPSIISRKYIPCFRFFVKERVMGKDNSIGNFNPTTNGSGFGVQPGIGSPDGLKGGNLHDTFKVDKTGNVSSGHSTVDFGGGLKTSVPWGSGNNK